MMFFPINAKMHAATMDAYNATTKQRQSENPAQISSLSRDCQAGSDNHAAIAKLTAARGQPISGAERLRKPGSGNGDAEKYGHNTAIRAPRAATQARGAFPLNGFMAVLPRIKLTDMSCLSAGVTCPCSKRIRKIALRSNQSSAVTILEDSLKIQEIANPAHTELRFFTSGLSSNTAPARLS